MERERWGGGRNLFLIWEGAQSLIVIANIERNYIFNDY